MNALVRNKLIKPIRYKINIQNIVATADFGKEFDLETIFQKYNTLYEPEQFLGVILKLENLNVTVLLFSTGKCVITGAKSIEILNQSITYIENIVGSDT